MNQTSETQRGIRSERKGQEAALKSKTDANGSHPGRQELQELLAGLKSTPKKVPDTYIWDEDSTALYEKVRCSMLKGLPK